jgi:hypothetical protein
MEQNKEKSYINIYRENNFFKQFKAQNLKLITVLFASIVIHLW